MFIEKLKTNTGVIYGVNTVEDKDFLIRKGFDIAKLETDTLIKEKKIAFNNAIQTHLDSKAKEFRYDNMMSARSYAGYDNPFQAEAQKLAVWASNCWVKAGAIEADVEAGKRDMPTIDEVLSELPVYE